MTKEDEKDAKEQAKADAEAKAKAEAEKDEDLSAPAGDPHDQRDPEHKAADERDAAAVRSARTPHEGPAPTQDVGIGAGEDGDRFIRQDT